MVRTVLSEGAHIATRAIERSISHNEIARAPYSEAAHEHLLAQGENSVDLTEQYGWIDYWGTTDEGDEWRVYLIRPNRPALIAYGVDFSGLRSTECIRHGSFGPIVWDAADDSTRMVTQRDLDTLPVGHDLDEDEEAATMAPWRGPKPRKLPEESA